MQSSCNGCVCTYVSPVCATVHTNVKGVGFFIPLRSVAVSMYYTYMYIQVCIVRSCVCTSNCDVLHVSLCSLYSV